MNEIDGQCGIGSYSLPQNESGLLPAAMSVVGAAVLEEGRCTNLKVALDGNNLHLYPEEVVRGLTRPRKGVRFVHMVSPNPNPKPNSDANPNPSPSPNASPNPNPTPIPNPNQLREPLRLVASYYAYHAEGAMGGENNLSYWTSFRSRLNNLSVSDGVAVVAQMLEADQLPTMVSMHRQLTRAGRASASGGGDVMETRMEEFEVNLTRTRTQTRTRTPTQT